MPASRVHNSLALRTAVVTTHALIAMIICFSLGPSADAKAGALGPGPFSFISVDANGLVFNVESRQSKAVLFEGTPSLRAADGPVFKSFSAKPKVNGAGTRLVQGGEIDGRPVADFFPVGSTRLIEIKNGNGTTTQLLVEREGDLLFVNSIDRLQAGAAQISGTTPETDVDARSDKALTVAFPKGAKTYRVTIAVTLPPLPEGATAQGALAFPVPAGSHTAPKTPGGEKDNLAHE